MGNKSSIADDYEGYSDPIVTDAPVPLRAAVRDPARRVESLHRENLAAMLARESALTASGDTDPVAKMLAEFGRDGSERNLYETVKFKAEHRNVWREALEALQREQSSDALMAAFERLQAEILDPRTPADWIAKGMPALSEAMWKRVDTHEEILQRFVDFMLGQCTRNPELWKLAHSLGAIHLVSTTRQHYYYENEPLTRSCDQLLNLGQRLTRVDRGDVWMATHVYCLIDDLPYLSPFARSDRLIVGVISSADHARAGKFFCRLTCSKAGTPIKTNPARGEFPQYDFLGALQGEGAEEAECVLLEVHEVMRMNKKLLGSVMLPWPKYHGKYEGWVDVSAPSGERVCRVNLLLATGGNMRKGAPPLVAEDIATLFPETPYTMLAGQHNSAFDLESEIEFPAGERLEVRPGRVISVVRMDAKNTRKPVATLFFVHGVGGCAEQWKEQMLFFCERGYNCIAYDMFGHGKSDHPQNKGGENYYTFMEFCLDALALFDLYRAHDGVEGACDRNILVGHSYGCAMAVYMADHRWGAVEKVILISGGDATDLTPTSIKVPTVVLDVTKSFLLKKAKKRMFDPNAVPEVVRNSRFDTPMHVLKGLFSGMEWDDGERAHRYLSVPAFLLSGINDRYSTPAEMRAMCSLIPLSEYKLIRDAGHMVIMEKPMEVNNAMLEYLTRAESVGGACLPMPGQSAQQRAYPLTRALRPLEVLLLGSGPDFNLITELSKHVTVEDDACYREWMLAVSIVMARQGCQLYWFKAVLRSNIEAHGWVTESLRNIQQVLRLIAKPFDLAFFRTAFGELNTAVRGDDAAMRLMTGFASTYVPGKPRAPELVASVEALLQRYISAAVAAVDVAPSDVREAIQAIFKYSARPPAGTALPSNIVEHIVVGGWLLSGFADSLVLGDRWSPEAYSAFSFLSQVFRTAAAGETFTTKERFPLQDLDAILPSTSLALASLVIALANVSEDDDRATGLTQPVNVPVATYEDALRFIARRIAFAVAALEKRASAEHSSAEAKVEPKIAGVSLDHIRQVLARIPPAADPAAPLGVTSEDWFLPDEPPPSPDGGS